MMKEYKLTATTNSSGEDIFRLLLDGDPVIDISVKKNEGGAELKKMFSILLTSLVQEPIAVSYVETPGYSVGMYKDVCREYAIALGREIEQATEKVSSEGLLGWSVE